MIRYFKVRNYGSIRDERVLDMEATDDATLEDYYCVTARDAERREPVRLLKLAVLYGPNASGKSTVLEALEAFRDLHLQPNQKKHEEIGVYNPFLFDGRSGGEPTELELDFFVKDRDSGDYVEYRYTVKFDRRYILEERLLHWPNHREAEVFSRTTDLDAELSRISWGSTVKDDQKYKDGLELHTIPNVTVLGAYSGVNARIDALEKVSAWMRERWMPGIGPKTRLFEWAKRQIRNEEGGRAILRELINKADFHINDFDVVEEDAPTEALKKLLDAFGREDDRREGIKDAKMLRADFEHTVRHQGEERRYTLSERRESGGTRRFVGLGAVIQKMILGHRDLATIDEVETSLHVDLLKHYILVFLRNTGESQLICTTHDVSLLRERDMLREDAVWFTEKQDDGTTDLFCLSDFDSRTFRKGSSIYNAYMNGKLGAKPNLGSAHIDKTGLDD
ncbi:hypothetical protein FUAX_54910 (plasmid) [Fulvitalea axinellae]|uniref:ATPase AAA-type core domain-containing protein n=1 Tax=Fulvitalea axinellae TaxID=1182444 RepID=A0AAU9D3A5_9BACT|nr:hypothetical protein FUAX_54910 [Fulvitalea axinellae]